MSFYPLRKSFCFNICFFFFTGWFFDCTQSYDLAFFFSGSCVLLGACILLLLSLPCWKKKPADIDRPDIQYTCTCDKVASVS